MELTTAHSIELYRMTVIRSALKLYIKTGMKANTMYTPTNMVQAVSQKTSKKYKRGKAGMAEALNDLEAWIFMHHKQLNNEEIPL